MANALAGSLCAQGGEILCAAEVQRIIVERGRAVGVALADGREHRAGIVVSNLDPKRTFLECFDAGDLPAEVRTRAKNFKIRGSSGKLNIALDGLPTFPALPKNSPLMLADMHFSDSLARLERAYDDWKAGTWSQDPYLDMLIPSTVDPTMAPPGKHMMTVFVQYCPPKLASGPWTPEARDAFGQTVIDQIAQCSPDFKRLILDCEVRTPKGVGGRSGADRGQHLPRRTDLRPTAVQPPLPRLRPVPGAVAGPVPVRFRHPSGRRRDGRAGGQRGPGNPP